MAVKANFAIIYSRGPEFPTNSVQEQWPAEHHQYFAELTERGVVRLAGPFLDDMMSGIVLLRASDFAAAKRISDDDPAVRSGMMVGKVRPFFTLFEA